MKHFLVFYNFVPDFMERRGPYRKEHLTLLSEAAGRGDLVLAGACSDPGDALGVLLFKAPDRTTAENFAKSDPYVVNGVVASWQVREWTTVRGKDALTQVNI